jgi:hypothetical protein
MFRNLKNGADDKANLGLRMVHDVFVTFGGVCYKLDARIHKVAVHEIGKDEKLKIGSEWWTEIFFFYGFTAILALLEMKR